jgi:hypothetical protein
MSELQTWFSIEIKRGAIRSKSRGSVGLIVTVKAAPEVEEFIASSGDNQAIDIANYGDGWVPMGDKPLSVYHVSKGLEAIRNPYSLAHVANSQLIISAARRDGLDFDQIANLGVLRLAGISSPDGVTFGVTGVFSKGYAKKVADLLTAQAGSFINDYVVPIRISLSVVGNK